MAQFLIWFGGIALFLVLVAGGPAIGWAISVRKKRLTNTIIMECQKPLDDTQSIAIPDLGEDTFAEQYFAEDPLFSHSLPRELEPAMIALQVFDDLAAARALTGVGANLDAEWQEWNLVEDDAEPLTFIFDNSANIFIPADILAAA